MTGVTGPARAVHLVRRFAAVLRSGGPSAHDEAWARSRLSGAEWVLWRRQRATDRRHAIAVARHVQAADPDAPGWVAAAALLHDVGKAGADLGTGGRVAASLLKLLHIRRAPGTLGRYLRYPDLGAEQLRRAGSEPHVVAWASQHHQPPRRWTVPEPWGHLLVAADDEAV